MPGSPRDLYLDLLIQILTNMVYRDPSTHPFNRGPFQADLRMTGGDWPLLAHTMVGVRRLQSLRELAQRAIDEDIPGDFIETGVWRGGCCILLRAVLAANAVTDRQVYAADSFAGLPAPNPLAYPEDAGFDLSGYKQLAVPLDRVKENFARYGLLDDQVVFVEGPFTETLRTLPVDRFALLRLDGDLYESTYVALETLYPKLSPGGFVIVDDFGLLPPCRKAVIDYRERMHIDAPMQEIDASGVWWQKEQSAGRG
jgi:O-methyltransferase